jgi:hypothetical protein
MGTPIYEYRQKNKNDQEKMKELVKALVSPMFILQVALDDTHHDLSSSNSAVLDRSKRRPTRCCSYRLRDIPTIESCCHPLYRWDDNTFSNDSGGNVGVKPCSCSQSGQLCDWIANRCHLGRFSRGHILVCSSLRRAQQQLEVPFPTYSIARKWLEPDGGKRWFHIEMACASRPVEEGDKEKFAERLAKYAYCLLHFGLVEWNSNWR